MNEQLKMDLRRKRRPRYRPQDVNGGLCKESEPQNASYTRPNYFKMSTPSYMPEFVSPSVLLNQNAKLLMKLINRANKVLRDNRSAKDHSEKELNKKESNTKDRIISEPCQTAKRHGQSSKNQKTQSQKKSKQLYNFKEQVQNNQILKNLSQQQVLKGVKNIQSIPALPNNTGIYSGPLSSQLTQLQSLYPNLKGLNYETLTQCPNPHIFQFEGKKDKSMDKSVDYLNSNHSNVVGSKSQKKSQTGEQVPKGGKKKPREVNIVHHNKTEDKVFKRSAYHVAIAYHIYLKGLYEQGITSGVLLDPTYRARLVKEQSYR